MIINEKLLLHGFLLQFKYELHYWRLTKYGLGVAADQPAAAQKWKKWKIWQIVVFACIASFTSSYVCEMHSKESQGNEWKWKCRWENVCRPANTTGSCILIQIMNLDRYFNEWNSINVKVALVKHTLFVFRGWRMQRSHQVYCDIRQRALLFPIFWKDEC